MRCPKCGSEKVHIVETTNITQSSGYSCGKGCCGALLFGNILGALCGIGGKTKTNTEHISYWICDGCGAKFQHGMTEQMFEFKKMFDNFNGVVNFVDLDDSTDQLYRIRVSLENLKPFQDLWECVSCNSHIAPAETLETILILIFKDNLPDLVCCLTAKKGGAKKKISDVFNSLDNDHMSMGEAIFQESDYGWDLSLYTGIVLLESDLFYYNGNATYHWKYKDIQSVNVSENDIKIYNPEASKMVSFKDFLMAGKIKGDRMRVFVRFLQGIMPENLTYAASPEASEPNKVRNRNGKNNSASFMHDGNLYVFTESSGLLENRSELLEVNQRGEYHSFPLANGDTVFNVDSDDHFLYFRVQDRISRISWQNIKNRNAQFETIIPPSAGIEGLILMDQWLYYIRNKNLMRRNINPGSVEEVCTSIICKAPLIRSENRIYFRNAGEKKKLYCFDTQTGAVEKVFDREKIGDYTICGDKVFFYQGVLGVQLNVYDMKTGEIGIIEETASGVNSADDKLYYRKGNTFIEYDIFSGDKKQIFMPKDMQAGIDIEIAGDLICCKVRGSIALNYVINMENGRGQEL